MSIKIFHTADVHIGMKFMGRYGPDVREMLIEARFETLARMVEISNKEGCHLFVIAGDLFETPLASQKDILRVAKILRECDGLVAILPGNHDHIRSDGEGLWKRFQERAADNTLLLLDADRYDQTLADTNVAIYPGPCTKKHSSSNAISWVAKRKKPARVSHYIGIAHGSLKGVSPDFDEQYYPMTKSELGAAGMDLWLMGHTHVRVPAKKGGTGGGIFFPSTPEPDGFDCSHEGYAWLYELDDQGIRYRAVQTGQFQFSKLEKSIGSEKDIEALKAEFREYRPDSDLVKLRLTGRVPRELLEMRSEIISEIEGNVLHLEVDHCELFEQITAKEINAEFTDGSFPHSLLMEFVKDKKNPLVVQTAYELIREVRE